MRPKIIRTATIVAAVMSVFAVSLNLGVGVHADPKAGGPSKSNPDCNGKGPERDCDEDGDHNQGGTCDGNEGHKGDCDDAGEPEVSVVIVPGNPGNNGNNGNDVNPDCNGTGPERFCGEEDGDHNQGGKCDGNEGKHDPLDCLPQTTPTPTPTPIPTPTPPDDPRIVLDKSGPGKIHLGEAFSYTFEVMNDGDQTLTAVTLTDAQLGVYEDLPDLLSGDAAVVTVNSNAPAESGTVVNTAEACGRSGAAKACDTDSHTITVIDPGIRVSKSADPGSVDPGQTVTYTYVVTNTGDAVLTGITVVDDVLGDVGSADSLTAGDSATFTKDYTVQADSPSENVATACGTDALGVETCDEATEQIQIVLPAGPQTRGDSLPRTGFPLLLWAAGALNLVAAGLAMVDLRRRRQAR